MKSIDTLILELLEAPDDPPDIGFGLGTDFSELDVLGPGDVQCLGCGCTEDQACPGGCGWSERFLLQGIPICTNCEGPMIAMEINQAVYELWRDHPEILRRPPARPV